MRAGQCVGRQGRLDDLILDSGGEQGQGALFARAGRQVLQPAPDLFLDRGGDQDPFGGDDVLHPLLSPGPVFRCVESRQRLEREIGLVTAQHEELPARK